MGFVSSRRGIGITSEKLVREESSYDGESHYIVLFWCFVLLVSFCYAGVRGLCSVTLAD